MKKNLNDILKLMEEKSKSNSFRNCDSEWFLKNDKNTEIEYDNHN